MYVHPKKPLWKRVWMERWAYVFVFLPIASFLVLFAYPVILAFVASFYNFDNFHWKPLEYPLYNYVRALRDPLLGRAFANVIELFLISWFGGQTVSLLIALMLNSLKRFGGLYRTLYYIPVVTSIVVVATLFRWLFGSDAYNPVNAVLHTLFGMEPIRWLWEPGIVIPTIAVVGMWLGLGWSIIIWTAGLNGIPIEFYETALLDGASAWQKLWYITLPLLKPIILYNAVMGFIGGMKEFGLVFTIASGTGATGMNSALATPVLMIYNYGFRQLQMGYASALAYVLTLFLLIISAIQFKVFGATNTYE